MKFRIKNNETLEEFIIDSRIIPGWTDIQEWCAKKEVAYGPNPFYEMIQTDAEQEIEDEDFNRRKEIGKIIDDELDVTDFKILLILASKRIHQLDNTYFPNKYVTAVQNILDRVEAL